MVHGRPLPWRSLCWASPDAVRRTPPAHRERLVASQLPVIPLLDGALWYEYNDSHFTGFPTADNLWINLAPYTYQAAAIIMDHLKPMK